MATIAVRIGRRVWNMRATEGDGDYAINVSHSRIYDAKLIGGNICNFLQHVVRDAAAPIRVMHTVLQS